jgi:Erythromycin esterase
LRGTLHAIRDLSTVKEAARLEAQLLMLIRGFYYEGWDATHKALRDWPRRVGSGSRPTTGPSRLRLTGEGQPSVRPALPGSYEALFYATGLGRFPAQLGEGDTMTEGLSAPELERAIGVINLPDTERLSHYFLARLPASLTPRYFDERWAVEPLERTAKWEAGEVPETFPFGV